MRANKYLYTVSLDNENSVIFNGINKEFLVLKKDNLDSFVKLLQTPDLYTKSHENIIKKTM